MADAGSLLQMGKDIAAIRALLEEQIERQEELIEKQEKDRLEDDVRGLKEMIRTVMEHNPKHLPGRPLQDR